MTRWRGAREGGVGWRNDEEEGGGFGNKRERGKGRVMSSSPVEISSPPLACQRRREGDVSCSLADALMRID